MLFSRSHITVLGLSLIVSLKVSGYDNNPPDHHGLIANLIIKSQEPVFWFARKKIYPEMTLRTVTLGGEKYAYLIRKGERKGTVILLHGIMSRKDHFMPLVHHWVKMNKPLPTIIAVDLLGHGSHDYPENYDFSIENFTRHAARFIRHIKHKNGNRPFIIVGHSLGGGVAALLRPLEKVSASATILISPAGVGTTNLTDFKAGIETEKKLPFDFGSADVCQLLEIPFEQHGRLVSKLLNSVCFFYSYLDCPYETWAKNRMFAQLAESEHQLLNQKPTRAFFDDHIHQPVFLIWTRSDRMFDRSRYAAIGEYLHHKKLGEGMEFEGSHVWPIEHPRQAAELVDSLVMRFLPQVAPDASPANPIILFWLTSVMWRLSLASQ